ncbi:hypothetical protein H7X69_00090 [Candidatus Saccharibacteria bacterium]|nr:hypothetical protein [Candidatus Saccharibacteria bacterium]
MSNKMYDELALERSIRERFGVEVTVRQTIVSHSPVGYSAEATLFLTNKKQLYLYITGQSKLLLSDIKKLVSRMGLRAELYFPPKGRPLYFDEIGRSKFYEVFPGRSQVSNDDIIFYRTLAPYNPALVLISEVKNGEVYQFDTDASGQWRVAAKFTYRRIKTS